MNILYMAAGVPWRSVFCRTYKKVCVLRTLVPERGRVSGLSGLLGFQMPCLFHLLTGWYCPGCGGTRAVKYLLQGNLALSFRYHPLVLYGAVIALAKLASVIAARATGSRKYELRHGNALAYGALVIVAANWMIKNYLLIKGIDLLNAPLY